MSERPDYIGCIWVAYMDGRPKKSWCGKALGNLDFYFQSLDHAALNALNEGRLVPCPECVAAAHHALTSQK